MRIEVKKSHDKLPANGTSWRRLRAAIRRGKKIDVVLNMGVKLVAKSAAIIYNKIPFER